MSYVEHGPRIFLAGDNRKRINSRKQEESKELGCENNNFNIGEKERHLVYGDYVLPRKRSEGRLKNYESCTDIRAWSQNTLDNSKYIRELAEHAKTPGKIVPLNVVIDNVIGLGAQTQNELNACRRELQKYKSLTLTNEQLHQLQISGPVSPRLQRSRSKPDSNLKKIDTIRSYSSSPSRKPKLQSVDKSLQTEIDCSKNENYSTNVKSRGTSAIELSSKNNFIENGKENSKEKKDDLDFESTVSTSGEEFTAEDFDVVENAEDDDDEDDFELEDRKSRGKKNSQVTISTSGTSGRTETETGTGSASETGSITDYDTEEETNSNSNNNRNNKAAIIKKDSEIIALKNELGAKEAEIEELKDANKILEKTLKEKDEGIQFLKGNLMKISEQQLSTGVGDEIIYESEMLKKKIGVCECAISDLKEDLKEKMSMCRAQAHEIEDLRFRLKESEALRIERDTLARKVNEMGDLLIDAEKCARGLSEMKSALRERDELRCQNREQSCLLADQEDEINRLVLLVKRLSTKYEDRKMKMKGAMETMRLEMDEKTTKLCECQENLSSMEKEVSCLNLKLKNSMNSMDEFTLAYQDACNCADIDRDIYSQAKNALCKLNQTMLELKEYKCERENLLRQIDDMKKQILNNNKKLDNFCCLQNKNYNKNENSQQRYNEMSNLDLRKRKCLLQDEIEDLENELKNRGIKIDKNYENIVMENDHQLDDVASAKKTMNRFNNAMLDLDAWECEKATMKDTIERLKIQISTLTGTTETGSGENVERRIVDHASNSLAKLNQLLNELKEYQTERELMKNQIQNLTEALKDSQAAASCKGVTMLKQRLCDLRLEIEKERATHAKELKNLQEKLEESERSSSCAGVKNLRLKLREAIRAAGSDKKIDEVLSIHVKNSIEKMENISQAIKEANEDKLEIVKEMAQKNMEIEVRNVEIVKLKNQMIIESEKRRGEGDKVEESLKEIFKTRKEIDEKNNFIKNLEERIDSLRFQLIGSNEDQTSLKNRLKLIQDENNKLIFENDKKTRELNSKNEEIVSLVKKIDSLTKKIPDLRKLEEQIEEMNPRLNSLQSKNEKLTSEVATLQGILSERNDEIISLVDEREKNFEIVSNNNLNYENELAKHKKEFDRVFRANKTLTKKLLEAETKIIDLNGLISSLESDRTKLDEISNLQREIFRLTKDKRKLETDLRGLKSQLVSFENSNKKLDVNFNRINVENENLKIEIKNLNEENLRISNELVGQISAKEKLSVLPDKLNKNIASIKLRLKNTEEKAVNVLEKLKNRVEELETKSYNDDNLIKELQRVDKFRNDQVFINEEKISVLEKLNKELKSELKVRLEELKELNTKLREIENERKSDGKKSWISEKFGDTEKEDKNKEKKETNELLSNNENLSEIDDKTVAELTCRLNHAENENKQRQTEIQKLQCDLKSKNNEINSLREELKSLAEERDALNERIKNKEIQNSKRLQAVKSTYEGCVKAMLEQHNESVARLQSQYEEAIKDSDYFDSESWLRSLSMKQMADLHDRICLSKTAGSCGIIFDNEESNNLENNSGSITSLQRLNNQQDFNEKHQLNRKISNLENEIVQREQEARQKVYELEIMLEQEKKRSSDYVEAIKKEKEKNSELHNRLIILSVKNRRSLNPEKITTNSSRSSIISINSSRFTDLSKNPNENENDNENEKDILRRQSAYNQDRAENYGILLEQQRRIVKNLEMELMEGSDKEKSSYDLRKKDFIYQCSTYKK